MHSWILKKAHHDHVCVLNKKSRISSERMGFLDVQGMHVCLRAMHLWWRLQ